MQQDVGRNVQNVVHTVQACFDGFSMLQRVKSGCYVSRVQLLDQCYHTLAGSRARQKHAERGVAARASVVLMYGFFHLKFSYGNRE